MKRKIQNGIYLIVDPSMNRHVLLSRLKEIIHGEIAAIQIWDNFAPDENPVAFIQDIVRLSHSEKIPTLINNRWELLKQTDLDGVHFDRIPNGILQLKNEWNREVITGITCGNDLSTVQWADRNKMDYISFCSMFPSSTATSCELVTFDTIREARKITSLPIFLAGGIKHENIETLNELDYSGIALLSGIMNSEKPMKALKKFNEKIKKTQ